MDLTERPTSSEMEEAADTAGTGYAGAPTPTAREKERDRKKTKDDCARRGKERE
jgi:hypothetical protein